MPQEPGEPRKKLPERADALKVDLPFDDALRAALETKPPAQPKVSRKRRKRKD